MLQICIDSTKVTKPTDKNRNTSESNDNEGLITAG